MSLLENNKELHGFGATIHTLYITVADLKFFQIGNGMSPIDNEGATPCVTGIFKGIASIEDDALVIIGSENEPIKELSITLRPFNDWRSLTNRWDSHLKETGEPIVKNGNDDSSRIKQFLQNVHSKFNEHPPTASVGFYESWFIECDIHQEIFNCLATDFNNCDCKNIRIAIEMHPTLIDNEYAEIYEPVVFGVLDWDKHGTSGFGYTSSLTWEKSAGSAPQTEQIKNESSTLDNTLHTLQTNFDNINKSVKKELVSINFSIRIGLILLLLLILTIGFS